ncbi:MAG: DUF4159 domain-containing protein [Alphaproteobacteria bacterium]|nr:DUF4159 domain-containing protein [Alphaproteobacteria bacterium]
MLILGNLAFAAPWVLAALAALPVLLWLMRITPPSPRRVDFPAIRLLFGLKSAEEQPAKTPWWLLLLRAFVATLVILALANPILNPGARLEGSGTVVLVVDDGWAAADRWQARRDTLLNLLARAERENRPIVLLTTAPLADGSPARISGLMTAGEAREEVQALEPKPWPVDRAAAALALRAAAIERPAEVYWLTDGLTTPAAGAPEDNSARALAAALEDVGTLHVLADGTTDLAMVLSPPAIAGADLAFTVRRAPGAAGGSVWVRASAERGQLLSRQEVRFDAGAPETTFTLDLPAELRNRVMRVEVESERSAAAVALLDERWRRRPVGLVSGEALEAGQPLLSGLFYVERALSPYADVRQGTVALLLEREMSVMVLADVGRLVGTDRTRLERWVADGGVLIRFAGPRTAQETDDLMPTRLRRGERNLGGAMTWSEPAKLAPFPETSPFATLRVPPEVRVGRQVLAEPTIDIGEKTWARLEDGTPLVTGARRGDGWVVLFHTTANADWSNLPLSGLFVDMLRTLVRLSQGVAGQTSIVTLPPLALLDGFGRLTEPSPAAQPIGADALETTRPGPRHPPGYYGVDEARQAFNLGAALPRLVPISGLPSTVSLDAFNESRERNLMPWLLAAALLLGLVELLASFTLRGFFRRGAVFATASALALAVVVSGSPRDVVAQAQQQVPARPGAPVPVPPLPAPTADQFALNAALVTRLAYVVTGNGEIDRLSDAGLLGLTRVLAARTSVEGGNPVGVNIERDEIAFFPLLYWPVTGSEQRLSDAALAKVDNYMKTGGTILFDTRDAPEGGFGGTGRGTLALRTLLSQLDIPPLIPVPEGHVLTQAFYLLQDFPGRYSTGRVWVVQHSGGVNDGVSSIIIGPNDWAAAWALDADGWPLATVDTGDERQREIAFRFGINLVMYVLTGNYKADQVHLPAIMERLGQ